MKKIALIATLVFGTAGAAFAEDSSSSFSFNTYTQAAQAPQHQVLTSRNVALGGGHAVTNQAPAAYDRASSPYAGGGF
jgi:hypothetical protein